MTATLYKLVNGEQCGLIQANETGIITAEGYGSDLVNRSSFQIKTAEDVRPLPETLRAMSYIQIRVTTGKVELRW